MTTLTAKSNNKSFNFTHEMPATLNSKIKFLAFDTPFSFRELKGQKVITLEEYDIKKAGSGKELCKFFGRTSLPSGAINIVITDSDFEHLDVLKKQAEQITQALKVENESLAELCSKTYILREGYYMGDYSLENWSEIVVMRDATELETFTDKKEVKTYSLLGISNISKDLSIEWDSFVKSQTKDNNGYVNTEVSEEFAKKWIAISLQIQELKEKEKSIKEAKKQAEIEKAKAERQAKFDEAKATGKKVLLSSNFISGNDIPRRFRDEDSDMGNILTYAMPDGSISEDFSHAY